MLSGEKEMERDELANDRLNQAIAVACQMQRWRDFSAHVAAYLLMNALFTAGWALGGRGYFWPLWTLLGWGVGLSFQHFYAVLRRPIGSGEVLQRL
jgi:cytochrome b561